MRSYLLVLALVCQAHCWLNKIGKDFPAFECDPGDSLSSLRSKIDEDDTDRRWNFDCRSGGGFVSETCRWFLVETEVFEFVCPDNGIIAGLEGEAWKFDTGKNDRRWSIKCCEPNAHQFFECKLNEDVKVEDFGGKKDSIVIIDHTLDADDLPMGIIKKMHGRGEVSEHRTHYNIRTCKASSCQATGMTFLEDPGITRSSRALVSMATTVNCEGNLELEFQEGSVDSLEEGVEITTTKSSSWSLGASIGLDVKATMGMKTFGYGFTASISHTSETAHSETLGKTKSFSTTTASFLNFGGPAAVLSVSEVDKYETSKDSVSVDYKVRCSDGKSFTRRGKVAISATSFGKTHFRQRVAVFANETVCVEHRQKIETCIKNLNVGTATGHKDITTQYEKCFIVDNVQVAEHVGL